MKKWIAIVLSILNLVLLVVIIVLFKPQEKHKQIFVPVEMPQVIVNHNLPDSANFAGEVVPLGNIFVREALDKELQINSYWHSSTMQIIKKANRWFPVIEPILKEHGIPEDFKYLALIESGLENVVSPRGAAGFWQIMKATGKEYGLEINKDIDERYHVEKATEVACKYLNKAYKKFNSWSLAAAAYNAGNRRISKEFKAQGAESYYDMFLNTETGRYIYRILAIKKIIKSPVTYGFHISADDLYPPLSFETIEVKKSINSLSDFADKHGISYMELKKFNPWLRNKQLRNSKKKTYYIKVPDSAFRTLLK